MTTTKNKTNGEVGMELYEKPNSDGGLSDYASVDDIKRQVQIIQETMEAVMKKDEHYGTIPGTNKPTLLKSGAEKLSILFRLAPRYEVERIDSANGHREYEIKCELTHKNTGNFIGEGLGSCSTMEKKYRYRTGDEATGVSVPRHYWDNREQSILENALEKNDIEIPAGATIGTTKEDGNWQISFKQTIENPDIADVYNTVLKMAKKRAHVDAILTATAASDIFTQDVEDMPDLGGNDQSDSNSSKGLKNDFVKGRDWLNKTEKDSDELTKMWKNATKLIRAREYDAQEIIDSYNMKDELAEELISIENKTKQKNN